jgi:formylglycine-generating enzyme
MNMRFALLIMLSLAMLPAADPQPATPTDPIAKPTWASAMGKDQYGTWVDASLAGVDQRMRWIPPGTFTMGSSLKERDAITDEGYRSGLLDGEIAHQVTLTHGFWLDECVCTQTIWLKVMGTNPSQFGVDPHYPVESVSWDDCQEFCIEASRLIQGAEIRLPTEAEWEYACRAGTQGRYSGGSLNDLGWYNWNSGQHVHAVKGKSPNPWGLYDMHGNVYQWCLDWIAEYSTNPVSDPIGPNSGKNRIVRGGSWSCESQSCRSASRGADPTEYHANDLGFRLCISAQPDKKP